jgi:hypothetical protein
MDDPQRALVDRGPSALQHGRVPSVYDRDPGMLVRYVHPSWGPTTDWALVTPASGSAPYQVRAGWAVSSCVGGAPLAAAGNSSLDLAGGVAAFTFRTDAVRYFDAGGAELAQDPATGLVPFGATRVEGIGVTVSWAAQGWGLSDATSTFGGDCEANLQRPPPEEGAAP